MKILSVETSTMLGGVAVLDGVGGLIAEIRLNVKTTHSERLMTATSQVLAQAGLDLAEIDVRIGMSTVKGLSYSTGRPMVTVPTLEAFAWNFPFSMHPVCLMLDARRGEVYSALFRWKDDCYVREIEETSIHPEKMLARLDGDVLFAGEGVTLYMDIIREKLGQRAWVAPPDKMVPAPSAIAMLGLRKALAGELTDPMDAVPFYIRRSEAEVKCGQSL
ncbi:MAG: tRNA (adenosine(37)-N6)-threonylcarbamoyltransferase complex dimerization subunit type 1 TsaB [Nitrospirae bacterium]|nr:tRNA (adenosine(37)-N6)-threonylcarbamoyltransferase complex dimerization subunit type 1 TsaB [Nitrospirota bacterium]